MDGIYGGNRYSDVCISKVRRGNFESGAIS